MSDIIRCMREGYKDKFSIKSVGKVYRIKDSAKEYCWHFGVLLYVSVIFGSFSIIFFGTCCWVKCLLWLYPLFASIACIVGVAVLCLIRSGFLSLSMTISLCMACR